MEINTEEYIKTIVQALCEYPDEVKVEKTIDEQGTLLTIDCDPKDRGIVIGKEGKTATALRQIMHIIGYKVRERISIKFAFDKYAPREEEAE